MSTAQTRPQWSLPRGRVIRRALRSDITQEYLLYVPETVAPDARLLVSVHGISRNAHEQAAVFSRICEERGVIMLAPIFTAEQHDDYQRLGRRSRGARVDLLLNQYVAEVATLTGADVTQIYLFGFSGGAQFVHRYAMAHPHRVARAVVASAGWYTFPDNSQRYPYGIRPHRDLAGVSFNPEEFLRIPIEVVVGAHDTGTSNLRSTTRTDEQQGRNRLERARNWVDAMRELAFACGIEPSVTLTEVEGIDHSFRAFCQRGDLVDVVGRSLFDDRPEPVHLSVVSGTSAASNDPAEYSSTNRLES